MPSFRLFIAGIAVAVLLSTAGSAAPIRLRGVDGRTLAPFEPAGRANVIFFIQTDCPVSNSYAPEIQRVCRDYGPRGVGCTLVYEDVDMARSSGTLDAAVRAHLRDYRYDGIPAGVDRDRAIARHVGATITPQAVIVDRSATVQYSGRIDNFYADVGRPRQQVTERDLRNALDAILAGKPAPKRETQPVGCHIIDPHSLEKH